ncbi:hypothetical protein EIP91_002502 [Steccherinum ochraceum]|uniref:F-box domain-containing protein n=1 Tax=Steccherinum ochraceum TaxID=92696 RepID=A0A4R0RNT7_9APHY|nr:hypothetical protein EIP91_002502 [Steccherinum ochraceum]
MSNMLSKFIPDDLMEQILLAADVESVIRCRRVARRFHKLIEHSTRLRYKVELALDNLEDEFPSKYTIAERLEMLRSRRRAWNTVQFKDKRFVIRERNANFHTRLTPSCITGYDARVDPRDPPGVISISRVQDGQVEDSWKVSTADVVIGQLESFCLYNKHELLVLLEHRDDDWIVHFRCWKTDSAHSRAFHPHFLAGSGVLGPLSSGGLGIHVRMRVVEEYAVVDWDALDDRRRLVIYNWHTGETVVNIFSSSPFDFMLVSQRYLLLVYDTLDGPFSLSVIDLHDANEQRAPEIALQKLQDSAEARPSTLFSSLGSMITLVVGYVDPLQIMEEEEEFTLFLPQPVLMDCLDKAQNGPRSFSWDEWGPDNTRLIRTLTSSRMDFFTPLGQRAISWGSPLNPDDGRLTATGNIMELHLYDFASLAVRKHRTDLELGRAEGGVELSECWTYGPSVVFKSQVLASMLPALIRHVNWRLDNGRDITEFRSIQLSDGGFLVDYELETRFEDHLLTF